MFCNNKWVKKVFCKTISLAKCFIKGYLAKSVLLNNIFSKMLCA